MTRWSEEEYQKFKARQEQLAPLPRDMAYHDLAGAEEPDEGPESKLQGKIVKWAKEWGRPIQSNRQTKGARTLLTPGWPDIVLILPRGRVLFIELKAGKGRLSEEQKQMRLMFMALGHEIHEIRSYRAFISLVEASNQALGASKPEKGSWVKGGLVW